jgi:hypothetical protein
MHNQTDTPQAAAVPPSASTLIAPALTAAGRSQKVAAYFGLTSQAVNAWASRGRMPANYIKPLCDLGTNIVTPVAILEAMTRESERSA